ncbi:MAG: TIGR00730 family Rossman fold protein [Thermodesulfobacteriota bacterium]|nr:TIGR00730 family Rossman fold protein [Thermodesulfobacteriota bacterium]
MKAEAKQSPTEGKLHFNDDNGAVDDTIKKLLRLAGDVQHADIVRQMIIASLKAGLEDGGKADLKQMNDALKELRFTTKVFKPYRQIRKVSVFGSARENLDSPIYQMAKLFGKRMVEAGYMVITGGGPGIMQAINEGAGTEKSFGVNIRLPMEQEPNAVVKDNPRCITYKYFFTRKVAFIKEADAVALFPGGFGTLDEAMETLTLIQTGKCDPMPVVMMDLPDGSYWRTLIRFMQSEVINNSRADKTGFSLFQVINSVDDAVAHINRFYRNFHSIRYVGPRLVIRLNRAIDNCCMEELASEFKDILTHPEGIRMSGPLPDEFDSPEIAHLPRIVVDFNKRDYGRLRSLIDTINAL